jgi:phytoene synthase
MNNLEIFHSFCGESSKMVTQKYSTSFYKASSLFKPEIRQHIYNIYGFVRLADEIVDTFHDYDKVNLMADFERNYQKIGEKWVVRRKSRQR